MDQTFTVTGMTCGHCEASVKRALLQLDPGAQVRIDRGQNKVQRHRAFCAERRQGPGQRRHAAARGAGRGHPRGRLRSGAMTAAIDGGPINIGQAARASGVSAKMVRHYESLGLLGEVARTDSGYRQYRAADVHTLRFIRRARELGFSMTEIAELVSLWHDRGRASADVKRIAQRHLAELEQRIVALQDMRRTLDDLLCHCHGDARPDCPILDELAAGSAPA